MGNRKFLVIIIGFVLVVSLVIIGGVFSQNEAVASVGDEKISEDELHEVLVKKYGQDALAFLIDNKVIEMEAKKEKVSASEKEIDEEWKDYVDAYGGKESLDAALEESGITEADLKKDIRQYIQIKKLVEPEIELTKEEVETYFNENIDSFHQQEQVKASHILVEEEKTAKEVAKKIKEGGDFSELAAEYSIDQSNADSGGEIGYFSRGAKDEAFEDAAFALEKGAVSEPVKTEAGYHIIKVTDKKAEKKAEFKEHQAEVEDLLFDEKVQQQFPTWLEEKKAEYEISNSLEDQ